MIKLKNHNHDVPATCDDHTMSVADFVTSVSEIKVPPPAGRSMATSWWLQKWPPTPARQSRSASRKALAGACRVHLRVLRRTPCKEAGSRGGSHRALGSALRSDPPPSPILQRMWETASLGSQWLAPAFHVRRPCVYLLAPLAPPVDAVSCGFRWLASASQFATASTVCFTLREGPQAGPNFVGCDSVSDIKLGLCAQVSNCRSRDATTLPSHGRRRTGAGPHMCVLP